MKKFLFVLGLVAFFGLAFVFADTEQTTVTFVIPASVDHSLSYGGTCSASNFYFVEVDATKDGTEDMVNVTSDTSGVAQCQNATIGGITINNVGSVNVNVTANFTASLPSGVTFKIAQANAGYQASCGGTVSTSTCADISTTAVLVAEDVTAQSGTQELWLWADMSNFNGGVATTGVARTLDTNAVQNT